MFYTMGASSTTAMLVCVLLVLPCALPTLGHSLLKDAAGGYKAGDPVGFLQGLLRGLDASMRRSDSSGVSSSVTNSVSDAALARLVFRYADLSGTSSEHLLEDAGWTLEALRERLTEERLTEALLDLLKDLKRAPEGPSSEGTKRAPEGPSSEGTKRAPEGPSSEGTKRAPEGPPEGTKRAPEGPFSEGTKRAPEGPPEGTKRAPEGPFSEGTKRAPEGLPGGTKRAPEGLPGGTKRAPEGPFSDEGFAGSEAWDTDCYRDLSTFIEPVTDVLFNATLELLPKTDVGDFIKGEIRYFYFRDPKEKEIPDWGLTMLDAFFKLPAALAGGNLHWVGGYEMCNAEKVSYYYNLSLPHEDREFNGQYCRVEVGARPEENVTASGLLLTLGMCVPSSCSPENVTSFLSDMTESRGSTRLLGIIQEVLGAEIQDVFCGHGDLSLDSDPTARAGVIVLLVFIALITAGTLWDGVFRRMWLRKCLTEHAPSSPPETPPPEYESVVEPSPNHQPSLQRPLSVASTSGLVVNDYNMAAVRGAPYWQQRPGIFDHVDLFLVAFSAYSNLRRLVRVDSTPQSGRLTQVDAVKYLAMGYLLLGQTYLLGPVVSFVLVTANIVPNLRTLPTQWNFMPILAFHNTVDTFFVCSGLLMTLYWFRRIRQNSGRLTPWLVIRNILHWYWRLMPSMMMVMMIFVVFYKYLASGPLSARSIPFADNCKPNWWTNILMVQNLVNLDKQCMAWTWYFSAVFQLHLVTSIVLIVYHFTRLGCYALMAALFAVHLGLTAAKSNSLLEKGILGSFREWNSYLFITPWAHAGAYYIGVSLAFILRDLGFKVNLKVGWRVLGWLVGVGLIVLVTYLPYDMYRDLDLSRWTQAGQVTYDTLSRTAWALGVAWILFACITGNGGFIGEVLSWRAFQPLGRLTYSMYIMHAIAILRYMYNRMSLLYVAENEMVYLFFGNFVMTHIYGLLCTILFEYPFRGLERMVSCRTRLDAMMAGAHPPVHEDGEDSGKTEPAREKNKFTSEKRPTVELEMSTRI